MLQKQKVRKWVNERHFKQKYEQQDTYRKEKTHDGKLKEKTNGIK